MPKWLLILLALVGVVFLVILYNTIQRYDGELAPNAQALHYKETGSLTMATYYVSESENDEYSDEARRFKYRYHNKDGKRFAQEVYDQLRTQGKFVRLLRWEDHDYKEIERANG